ncbi:MAG: serine/threonine-protein kinase [Polyangiales bacterium]
MTQDSAQRFGNYVLEERLAIGGMAEVFRARRVGAAGFSRTVCIKRILPTFCQDKPFVEMFIDEANTGAQLRHSNIVAIDDFGEVDGRYFLAMEFIQGVDASKLLTALCADRRSLPWEVGAFMLREVLSALDYAHRKKAPDGGPLNVVHRDVSPHNVLLSTAGEVKLTDFGIARARTRIHQTSAHVVKGKLAYMAPEQARAQPLDGRADLFSAGVSAYEWLANQRPFTGKNEPEVVSNLLKGRREKLTALRPDVPDALESVIDGLLEVDRNRRIESASAALALLDPLVSPSAGRLLAAIVAHYFFPHAVTSVGRVGPAFSPANLPPSPLLGQAAPIVPVVAPPPSNPPAPRLSLNAPARVESAVATQLSSPAQPSQPSYPSLSEGSDVAVSAPIDTASLSPHDGSTAVSDVLEAAPERTESRPVVLESSKTMGAEEAPLRPQDLVTRTSMRPVIDASSSIESVAPVTIAAEREDSSTVRAKEKRSSARRPSLVIVIVIGAAVLIATIALAILRSGREPSVNARPTVSERVVARDAIEPPRALPPAAVEQRSVTVRAEPAVTVTEAPRATAAPAATGAHARRSARRSRATASAPRVGAGLGTLAVQALPWAELTIDGSRDGITPIYRRITAGTHRITLVHPPSGHRATRVVTVRPGEVTRLLVELQ